MVYGAMFEPMLVYCWASVVFVWVKETLDLPSGMRCLIVDCVMCDAM